MKVIIEFNVEALTNYAWILPWDGPLMPRIHALMQCD